MKRQIVKVDSMVDFAIIEDDGAIKWESNGRYLMEDTMKKIIANGFSDFSIEATTAKRQEQNDAFLNAYRKRNAERKMSYEELNEYGCGQRVVDVITGKG